VKALYDVGEALFVANTGPLVEPTSRAAYDAGTVAVPPSLFAHNTQRAAAQSVLAQGGTTKGVVGRLRDALSKQGVSCGAYSIDGNARVLQPAGPAAAADVVDKWLGVKTFDESQTSMHLMPAIANLTASVKGSLFAEAWSDLLEQTLARTTFLAGALDATEVDGPWEATTNIGKQFYQVTIRAGPEGGGGVRPQY
jgi:hypothetical protein